MARVVNTKKTPFLIYFLILSLSFNLFFIYQNYRRTLVARVVDGDSFETADGKRIRLLGIDAPELDNCMGTQARDTLEILVKDKVVRLKDQVKDDYGRILANVFVGRIFVNKEIIDKGLGKYILGDNKYHGQMRQAYLLAKERNLGIFSSLCRQTDPVAEGCLIKANIRQGEKTYHLPDCRNYNQVIIDTSYGDRWFCSEEEAAGEGFVKAGGCQ